MNALTTELHLAPICLIVMYSCVAVTASEDLEKLSVAEDSSVDDEIRAELEELRRSRLYNLQERRAKDRKDHEPSHTHTEL